MLKKHIRYFLTALLFAAGGGAMGAENVQQAPAIPQEKAPAVIAPAEPEPEISEQQFELERQAMIDDLKEKLTVLGVAKDCAESAKTPAALHQCVESFRQAVLKKRPAP
jgi:hypothetical protein